jgi:hypothetical protein
LVAPWAAADRRVPGALDRAAQQSGLIAFLGFSGEFAIYERGRMVQCITR